MLTKWYEWDVLQVSNNLCRSLAVLEEMGVNVRGQSSFMRVISKMQHFGANQSNPLNNSQISCRSSRAAGSELQPHTVCSIRWFYVYTPGCSVGLYSLIIPSIIPSIINHIPHTVSRASTNSGPYVCPKLEKTVPSKRWFHVFSQPQWTLDPVSPDRWPDQPL